MKLSVVIVCNKWSPDLFRALESVKDIGNELLLYDTGNINDLEEKVKIFKAKVVRGDWHHYGETRKKAYLLASFDWILAIDSDEIIDDTLRKSILQIDLSKEQVVYKFRYKNFLGNKEIKYGEWGNTSHIRLANRKSVSLDTKIVHEAIVLNPGVKIKTLEGFVQHYTARNIEDYAQKMLRYAKLSSEKYLLEGRNLIGIKLFISPLFSFIKNYFIRRGFMDGWEGFLCAGMSSWYTFLKYAYLHENKNKRKQEVISLEYQVINIEEERLSI